MTSYEKDEPVIRNADVRSTRQPILPEEEAVYTGKVPILFWISLL